MEKLVIGLSHFWSVHMVYEGWIQHTVNQHYVMYMNADVQSTIDDALEAPPLIYYQNTCT
jgi:hypothetical protein